MRFCCSSIAALITHLHGGIRWCGGSSHAGFYYELVEAGSCAVVQGTVWSAAQAGGRGSNLHYWQPECLIDPVVSDEATAWRAAGRCMDGCAAHQGVGVGTNTTTGCADIDLRKGKGELLQCV